MDESPETFRPPYMSFQTFWRFIEELAGKPLPPAIDRSIMSTKSGSDKANLTQALSTLGLTGPDAKVLPPLVRLVQAEGEDRNLELRRLLETYYAAPLAVSAANGTPNDLTTAFTESYPSTNGGETRRKAITFFLHAARQAAIPLSPHFPTTRVGSGSATGTRVRKAPKKKNPPQPEEARQEQPVEEPTSRSRGHSQTVTLRSGGAVTLSYDVNMFDVDDEDEQFVLQLIKSLRSYRQGSAEASD